ncbi:MAG: enoyl-CoA hydratase/isomerase family protein [Dissulfurispiraceae bacterium]
MSTVDWISVDKREDIGVIVLESPESLNYLDSAALEKLGGLLTDLGKDRQVKVLIITGKGHFCAGADLREMKGKDTKKAEIFSRLGHSVCDSIEHMDKPVIAALRGFTLGAGCEIALACDMRIASESAKLGQPEFNLGLIPGFGGTQRLARLVGIGKAKELILTGRIINAKDAAIIGLVNSVVGDEELLEKVEETARVIAQKSPIALKLAKKLINENQRIGKELEREIEFFSSCFDTQDHIEGIKAFFEKRPPNFKGI